MYVLFKSAKTRCLRMGIYKNLEDALEDMLKVPMNDYYWVSWLEGYDKTLPDISGHNIRVRL